MRLSVSDRRTPVLTPLSGTSTGKLLLGSVSDMHRRVRASRGLGGACTDNRADGGDGRRRMICLAPVPRGTSPSPATAGGALDDSGFGRYRRRNSRRGTRCVRTNRVLANSASHLVVWPAAYQLCRAGLAPLGTEVRYFAVTSRRRPRLRRPERCAAAAEQLHPGMAEADHLGRPGRHPLP
jgi:hypothetical protein